MRQRDLCGSVVRAVHNENLTHDACGFEALSTPVDELAHGDLLVEGGNDDRELRCGDVVRGYEEPNVWVEPIAGSVHGGHGPSLADGHRASTLAGRRDGSPHASLVSEPVLITRTPLRVTLAGGSTDLPSYFSSRPGFVISAAIDKYVYIGLNRTFTDDYFLKYSALEQVSRADDIEHPIIRTALQLHDIGPSVEIVSLADIPAGTGLGSSGSFTVGLLRALYAWKREHVTAGDLADEACRVEIDLLGRPVGEAGSIHRRIRRHLLRVPRGRPRAGLALDIRTSAMHELEERLLMFFTGAREQPMRSWTISAAGPRRETSR